MSANLFMREIEVIAGGRSFKIPDYHIDFRIEFDDSEEPNDGEVVIYNLSQDSINQIRRNRPLILNAGYHGDVGTILSGTIESVKPRWDGVDLLTRIEVGDATDRWARTPVNKSYKKGIKARQIILDLLNMFGLEVGAFNLPRNPTYSKGRSVSGMLQTVLREIVKDCGAKLQVQNGAIFIQPPGSGRVTGFVLNKDTGMIDSPQRIDGDDDREWNVFSLLNHRIRTNSIIKIESRTANGNFRVVKGQHVANDQDHMTHMEVASI